MPEPPRTPEECWQLAWENRRLVGAYLARVYPANERDARVRRLGGWDDAWQVGLVALFRAAATWDPARSRLSNWAEYHLRQQLGRASRRAGLIALPSGPSPGAFNRRAERRALRARTCRHAARLARRADDSAPERVALQREALGGLARALGGLGAAERALVRRRYWDGASLGEIAREAGLTRQGVQWRLDRVMQKLRETLGVTP